MADDRLTALLFAGGPDERALNEQMPDDFLATGVRCVWVDSDPGFEPAITTPTLSGRDSRAVAEMVPMQLLTVVLAGRQGREPGRFRQIDKITRTL